ncbi:biliverdin-producing heme oxygenase [Aureimonas endophytica]|uniref:Biliverdin-producing heme oxygenase n=1 Tax=Aureimonas endophytica TaxID=2027858 RepID=A0A917E2I7_9HYPH|nr:biliverdin-producing heme oxygenase [Aureimonas endophytica]GGD96977.1 biliverdin-producing heme oxygenase [Aureimonas endophytica]
MFDPSPAATRGQEPEPGTGLRHRLRLETRLAHERLDAGFARIGEPDGGGGDYARFLIVNEACLGAIEPLLAASGVFRHFGDGAAAFRHEAARRDLAAMKLRPIVVSPFPLPRPSIAEAVGVTYVLEGSRLGARLILKRLRAAEEDGKPSAIATSFLEAAGQPTRFRAFLDAAEMLVATGADSDRAVDAANRTFDYFLEAMRTADRAQNGMRVI